MRYSVRNLTLLSLFKIALRHIVVLILAAIIAATAAFSYCNYIATPKYSGTGLVLVTNGAIITGGYNSEDGSITQNSDITASNNLLNTIIDILSTNDIFKQMSTELDNKYSYSTLKGSCTIKRKTDRSLFISVSFSASTRKEAVMLVNKYLEIAPDYIGKYIQNTATSVTLCDAASKTYPKTTNTTMVAAVCGAGFVYFILLLIYSANVVIQDEEDFKQRFDVPVIGCVPDFAQAKSNKYYYNKYYRRSGYYGYKK